MNKDILYSHIKGAFPELDNSTLNAYCVALWGSISAWHREERSKLTLLHKEELKASKGSKLPKGKRLTEEERADAIEEFLDTKLLEKTISAAEIAQLKDILNLKQRDRDVIINVVRYDEMKNGES
mgnify:CR=1 FL=1|jgi:hypothetical protein